MEEGYSTLKEDDPMGPRGFGFIVDEVLKLDETKVTASERQVLKIVCEKPRPPRQMTLRCQSTCGILEYLADLPV
jgi:hypothetical protein